MIKNLPAKQEMWVQSLGQEDPLEKEMQPTPVFLPGKSHEEMWIFFFTHFKISELFESLETRHIILILKKNF